MGASATANVSTAEAEVAQFGSVPELQRARILAALVELSQELGVERATVGHVVERSGVSRRTFYEMFADRNACFLAAFEQAVERGAARVLPAFGEGAEGAPRRAWRVRIRAGLLALLEFLDEEPSLGGLCVVDALAAGSAALESRARVVQALVDAVDQGRAEAKGGLQPSRLTAEGVVGGVLSVLHARLAARTAEPLSELLNPLMGAIVLPYLGVAAASQELARPVARSPRRRTRLRSNPLEGLGMRLTYRTVRVLVAIAGDPGASNRRIADAAGVRDQGQISKLLARLEHLGLAENHSGSAIRGEPNAWRLTGRGYEIAASLSRQIAV